ncbi:anthranilate phosphoribosyltransferase [Kiritimatiellaeota bacterium B1221]|nr:anthranilate phosphoribosyltransferase [Kiritimatiellaeota bacterium B1221]
MKQFIQHLIEGRDLSQQDAHEALTTIMKGEATPAQIAAFLTALRLRGETPEIVAGAAQAMREAFTPVTSIHPDAVDTCGTGGDGLNTFNISTTAAFVTAGAGVPVAKHGNRNVSSMSGSADVLTALGVNIAITPDQMGACLKEIGLAFLFAPSLHPAMKHAIGPRREIGIRTLFNVLGPISNPASTRRGVLGVFSKEMVKLVADALASLGTIHLLVVHGDDGLDEITNTTSTSISEVKDGKVESYKVSPQDFGLSVSKIDDLKGGDPEANASITRRILQGETGAKRDIVLLNAGAAIYAGGKAESLAEGIQKATESIDSGAAGQKLAQLIAFTTACTA